jgi:mannose-6-phosphate isomerase
MVLKRTTLHVDKPWGHEVIWADTELYVGKILHVNAGEALSLQYHREKDETVYVLSGYVRLEAGSSPENLETVELRAGDAMRMRPGTVHRMEAIEESDVLEASTPHLDDLVRLDDRYGRIKSHG